jgi:hypothetical protein
LAKLHEETRRKRPSKTNASAKPREPKWAKPVGEPAGATYTNVQMHDDKRTNTAGEAVALLRLRVRPQTPTMGEQVRETAVGCRAVATFHGPTGRINSATLDRGQEIHIAS